MTTHFTGSRSMRAEHIIVDENGDIVSKFGDTVDSVKVARVLRKGGEYHVRISDDGYTITETAPKQYRIFVSTFDSATGRRGAATMDVSTFKLAREMVKAMIHGCFAVRW